MSIHNYEKNILLAAAVNGTPVTSDTFEPPEGLLPEKIGLWISITLADPGNVITVEALWAGSDGQYLPTFLNPTQTVTATCILTVCNPGGAKSLELTLTSAGSGDDTVTVTARTNVEA